MLDEEVYADLDAELDARRRRPQPALPRRPAHPATGAHPLRAGRPVRARACCASTGGWSLSTVAEHGPLPFDEEVTDPGAGQARPGAGRGPADRLRGRLRRARRRRGGRRRPDRRQARSRAGERPAFVGLRCKSLEAPTRRRAVRTLDVFLDALGPPPPGFVITLPKVSAPEQVEAMVVLCGRLEQAHGLADGALRFEVQVETPPAVLGRRRHGHRRPADQRRRGPAAPGCTTARTTTAPRSASRPSTRAWTTRRPTTPRR